MTKTDKMLDELDRFWYEMIQRQRRDTFECLSEGFVGHEDIMECSDMMDMKNVTISNAGGAPKLN